MFAIKLRNEHGGALIMTIYFMIIVGMIGISLVTLTLSDTQLQIVSSQERKAFYSAQAGLEYGVKRVMVSDPAAFADWTETVTTGNGGSAKVSAVFLPKDKFRIVSEGKSEKFVKKLQREIDYIDVSRYAIYTSGKVSYTIAHSWPPSNILFIPNMPSLVRQNVTKMPLFDLDELREAAKPNGYYNKNLNVNTVFNFPPNHNVFVEKSLTFSSWNWFGWGHFTVMKDTRMKSAWLPFSTTFGTVYMPGDKKKFTSDKSIFRRSFIGGVITNGDIIGSSNKAKFPFWGKLTVFHHQPTIYKFMKSSVNGGPLIIDRKKWENLN